MKKFIRGGVALLALMGGYAIAASTDSVVLSGIVTSTLAITATDTGGAAGLSLDGAAAGAEQIVKVADLDMSTNNEQGLTVSFAGASLTKTGGTSIAYSVASVADTTVPLTGDLGWSVGTTQKTDPNSAAGSYPRDLFIKYTPAALQDPGTYAGSIALTVSDNP